MLSVNASAGTPALPTTLVRELYDRHRYIDAFAASAACWKPGIDTRQLSTDELVLAGRLAYRLGGPRLSRWLLRAAAGRDPSNASVRYHTRDLRLRGRHVLDDVKAFEACPDIGGDDRSLRASWCASDAVVWAGFRDFQRAQECLGRAHALSPDDAWVLACEAQVHGLGDCWGDALRAAERACEIDPRAPFAAFAAGICLLNLGRVKESAPRLAAAAADGQSFELALFASWQHSALAETCEGHGRRAALESASELADRAVALAPLADRETRRSFAIARLDIAGLLDDYAGIERWTDELRSPFHRQVLANLRANPDGRRLRLPYRRTVQKYEACLPASLSVAVSAGGMDVSADEMAAAVTFGGTSEWAAAEWLRGRGLHVRFFAATPDLAASLIERGIAFVVSWDAEEMGHAVAIVGLDQRAGTLLVHDPQSFRATECLLSILDPTLNPAGITAMAVVREDRAADLDGLLPPEAAIVEGTQRHRWALARQGPSAARRVAEDLLGQFPSHPGARFLQAVQLLEEGQAGQALARLHGILDGFRAAPRVRTAVLAAYQTLRNTARLRDVLQDIVERDRLPGLEAQQEWVRPPALYVYSYADMLRLSSATRGEAERLLHSLLRRQPSSAGAWHTLADLLSSGPDDAGALLSHRLASCLNASEAHHARAYADALAARGRQDEGFAWLESRARAYGASSVGIGTWVSWIAALEDHGHPDRALSACREALERHPKSGELLAFAVPFLARMGLWEMAGERLRTLEACDSPAAVHEAYTHFHRMRGSLGEAIEHAESWIREASRSMVARTTLLELLAARDGPEAAAARARDWMAENPDHEEFEDAYCRQMDCVASLGRRQYRVYRTRLKRNPEDARAWFELATARIRFYHAADDRSRKRLRAPIEALLDGCERTAAGSTAALNVRALWAAALGDWAGAVATSLETVESEPTAVHAYRHAWACSSRLPDGERRRVWAGMRPRLLGAPGHLSIARDVMALLVERFGLADAEAELDLWRAGRPDDPNVLEAAADLWLEHGRGRSDARRALALLEPAVERFPYHLGLRFSQALAHRLAGDTAAAERVVLEIARRHPGNPSAQIQLAWLKYQNHDVDGALAILAAAAALAPQNPEIPGARATMLLQGQRVDEARAAIDEGLARMPANVAWRDRAVSLLVQCRAPEQALAAARQGVALHPRGAYPCLVLGRTLVELRNFARIGEAESCLRRSLALDAGLFEAADLLSLCLAERERYEECLELLRAIETRMPDPSPALGRQAWIKRRQSQGAQGKLELIAVVNAAPWYAWGWWVLLDWMEEDRDWERAKTLLQRCPAQMRGNPAFRRRRLEVLRRAGVDTATLDAEWDELIRDYPDDGTLKAARQGTAEDREGPPIQFEAVQRDKIPWWTWWLLAWLAMQGLRQCGQL